LGPTLATKGRNGPNLANNQNDWIKKLEGKRETKAETNIRGGKGEMTAKHRAN
jgi:hypothetical protein